MTAFSRGPRTTLPHGDFPLVTSIVTFYNQGRFVRETLESMLAQEYPHQEVIAVDDGSTDDTPWACAAFGDRIRYIRQPNAGVSAARNAGERLASGTFLAFLDGDDLWSPTKISRQVEAALEHPGSGLIVSDGVKFDEAGVVTRTLYYGEVRRRLFDTGDPQVTLDCHNLMIDECLIQTPSQVLIPVAVRSRVGPWHEGIRISSDYEFFLRVATAGFPITFLGDRLVWYRAVTTSQSGPEARRGFVWGLDTFTIMREHGIRAGARDRRRIARRVDRLTRQLAKDAYYHGRHTDLNWARRYLFRLAMRSPRPHLVVPYLVAAWIPDALAGEVAQILHRAGRAWRASLGR